MHNVGTLQMLEPASSRLSKNFHGKHSLGYTRADKIIEHFAVVFSQMLLSTYKLQTYNFACDDGMEMT